MNNRLRDSGRRALEKLPRTGAAVTTRREVAALRRRVSELESEIQECRRLNRRLAEITDIVQELLIPVAQRDDSKLHEYLDRYASSL
jgi:flagellar biosynthesis/type III secretory pathway chaperone